MIDRVPHFDTVRPADHFVHTAEAHLGHPLARLLGDEEEKVDDILRRAREFPAQHRILRGDAHRAGVQVAFAHHDAAQRHQRSGGEAELLRAQQRGDNDVPSGLQLAVRLHDDAAAQLVEHQHLLRFGEPQLPRHARMLDRCERRRARASVVPADQHHVGMRLRHARGHRADAHLRDQFHGNARFGIDVLQVVNELRQILDRINVVMRRRRNQRHAGNGVAHSRDGFIHFVARKLAALAGLRALRDLNLQIVGVHHVMRRDAEASGGHLLDGGAALVGVPGLVLASFAGVRFSADAVHRDGQSLMRLRADRAERHRPGGEALHDFAGRLDFFERQGRIRQAQIHQSAQRAQVAILPVDQRGVLLERLELVRLHRVLQLGNRRRIQQMILPAGPEMIVSTQVERRFRLRHGPERVGVLAASLLGQNVQTDAFDARRRAGEIPVDERLVQADGLENLGAAIALQRGNAHLRKHLQQALVDRLEIVFQRCIQRDVAQKAVLHAAFDRLDGQIGIDGAGSIADEHGEVMYFARFAGFDDQRHLRSRPFADQMIVHGGERQQARDRRVFVVHAAVGKNQQTVAVADGERGAPAQAVQRAFQLARSARGRKHRLQRGGQKVAPTHAAQLFQVEIRQNRMRQLQRVAVLRRLFQNIALRADVAGQRHHQLLADRVDRRIRHLREQLLEVVKQRLRFIRQASQRRIRAHGAHRLLAVHRHGCDQQAQVFLGVSERPLAHQ